MAGLIFFNSQLFSIREVTVTGNKGISAEDILLAANFNLYKTIFQVDPVKTKQAILRNLRIASAEVSCQFPHRVLIKVRERVPACLLLYSDNLLIIGEDRVVMGIKDENDPIKLPIVTGILLKQVKLGEVINDPRFQAAVTIFRYTDANLREALSEISLKTYELYLDLANPNATIKVELGNFEQLEKKIYNLRAILSHAPKKLIKIDLREPDLPTVITSQGTSPTPH